MLVAKVKQIKEETHTLMDIKDLEDLIINNMGEDTWNAIMYFHEVEVQELKENGVYIEKDIKDYDLSLTALRNGVTEEIEILEKLINKVNEAKRLDRRSLTNELRGSIERLENNEGYF